MTKKFHSIVKKIATRLLGVKLVDQAILRINKWKMLYDINNAKNNGTILNIIEKLIKNHVSYCNQYIEALTSAAHLFLQEDNKELKVKVYEKIIGGLKVEDLPSFVVSEAGKLKIPLHTASSFRANMNMRSRKRQLGCFLAEWKLNHKLNAYKFIDILGDRRPTVFKEGYEYSNLPMQEGIAIKPLYGSGGEGVFLVFKQDKILKLKNKQLFTNYEELKSGMKLALDSKEVGKDEWIVEELITKNDIGCIVPHDLKFYCFYGKVALIVEVRRYPKLMFCFWSNNGDMVFTGKYEKNLFKGKGFMQDQLGMATSISLEIPAPFVRIDFLVAKDGLIFGEFTPRPGGYEMFNNKFDKMLGDYFIEAEERLIYDLFNGKKFLAYQTYLKEIEIL